MAKFDRIWGNFSNNYLHSNKRIRFEQRIVQYGVSNQRVIQK